MAGGFLRKWFAGPSPAPPDPEVQAALADLDRLARQRPALAGPAALMVVLLPRLYEDPIRTVVPSLTAEQVRAKLASGTPLLRGETFHIDEAAFRQRWQSVCESVQQHQGGDAGRKLHECLLAGRLDPGELLGHVLAGRTDAIHARVDALGLDAGLTSTVLRLLIIPVLGPVNRAWLPLRRGVAWDEGFCPTCGSWPLLAEVRGAGQSRFLRCGLCAAEWEFPAPTCPFCGLDDPLFLGHLDAAGEDPRYRAVTCDACRRYLKTVATPGPLSGPQLLVADLASMHLDQAAPERGYGAAD